MCTRRDDGLQLRTREIARVVGLSLALAAPVAARVDRTPVMGFEPSDSAPVLSHWIGNPSGPAGTVFLDSSTVHSGRYAGRIERDKQSPSSFSAFAYTLPADFTGRVLELRGWLRYQDVDGFTGLWQRQDGVGGGTWQFNNMAERQLHGSADWAEYRVSLPFDRRTRLVSVGAVLGGTGRVWADDLRLYVDGKPLADVLEQPNVQSVLETDTTFAASSGVSVDQVTPVQLDNLVVLGKVWGFLKYHHPAVVAGKRQWDFDLFRVAPAILAARSPRAAQSALVRWIDSLGAVPACTTCVELPAGRALAPRLAWLSDRARLGSELSERLLTIYRRRSDNVGPFYATPVSGIGNVDLSNELPYPRQADPDPGYRLLALYRFWNIIAYWFPYRDLIEGDWDGCLREFVPRLLAAGTREAYAREMMTLIARVGDTHANLWSAMETRPPRGKAALPVIVRFIQGQAVVAAYANPRLGPATGLRVGDAIASIEDVPVDSLVARWRPLYGASNEAAQRRDMGRALTRGLPGVSEVTVRREGQLVTLHPERVPDDSLDHSREWAHDHAGPTFRRLSGDLAYLKLSAVRSADVPRYLEGSAGAKGLVIDIRNYPAEFVVFDLGRHLVKAETPFVKFTSGDPKNPGSFVMGPAFSLTPQDPYLQAGVTILVDEVTQSSAEYTTMAFRSRPGTVVVGSQTAGADGNVSRFALPGAESTMISGIGVFYPDGRPTQRIGIVPDLEVRPTIAGIRAGRDEVLEAAVRRLLGRDITPAELAALDAPAPASASAPPR